MDSWREFSAADIAIGSGLNFAVRSFKMVADAPGVRALSRPLQALAQPSSAAMDFCGGGRRKAQLLACLCLQRIRDAASR